MQELFTGACEVREDLIPPHGGALRELLVQQQRAVDLRGEAVYLPSWDLTQRQTWDIELLLSGAFSPLEGFMGEADYTSVCEEMRLVDGTIWTIPVTLDVTEEFGRDISIGKRVALRHPEGVVLAILTVTDIWRPDFNREVELVYGTTDESHPGIFYLFHQTNPVYVGGMLNGLEVPPHHTFKHLRHTPSGLRGLFKKLGWERVVAFQTRNPMHRAHVELTKRAAVETEANLLLHPVVGRTSPGDVDYFARVRCPRTRMLWWRPQRSLRRKRRIRFCSI